MVQAENRRLSRTEITVLVDHSSASSTKQEAGGERVTSVSMLKPVKRQNLCSNVNQRSGKLPSPVFIHLA